MKCSVFNTLVIFAISLLEVKITLGGNCRSFLFPELKEKKGDCTRYIKCIDDIWTVEKCQSGYLFDLDNKECLPAHKANCGTNSRPGYMNRWTPHDESVKEVLPSECGADWHRLYSDPNKIVGGKVTAIESVPWQVGLLDPAENLFCGGSIITKRHIVTAAHCLLKGRRSTVLSPGDLVVRVGEFDQERKDYYEEDYKILDLHIHKDYDQTTKENDIALVTLTQTLTFNVAVFPICLPPDNSDKMFADDSSCLISGWGDTESSGSSSTKLRAVNTSLISRAKCIEGYLSTKYSILSSMVCAGDFENGGIDTCQGDSGGPLACKKGGRFYLYGVTSWGVMCGLDHLPGVYTKVTSFRSWIIDTLNKT